MYNVRLCRWEADTEASRHAVDEAEEAEISGPGSDHLEEDEER